MLSACVEIFYRPADLAHNKALRSLDIGLSLPSGLRALRDLELRFDCRLKAKARQVWADSTPTQQDIDRSNFPVFNECESR